MSEMIDEAALSELLDIMGEMYPKLVSTFETDSALRIQKMTDAITRANGPALAEIAHSLKGSAGSVCAIGLVNLFKQLEDCGKSCDFATAENLLAIVEPMLGRVVMGLKSKCKGLL